MTVYVVCMGAIFKLSKAKYRKYIQTVAKSGLADISQFGEFVGLVKDVTNITREQAGTLVDGGYISSLPAYKW